MIGMQISNNNLGFQNVLIVFEKGEKNINKV